MTIEEQIRMLDDTVARNLSTAGDATIGRDPVQTASGAWYSSSTQWVNMDSYLIYTIPAGGANQTITIADGGQTLEITPNGAPQWVTVPDPNEIQTPPYSFYKALRMK